MKDAFDDLFSRLGIDKERIFELDVMSIESLKTKKHREQRLKKNNRVSKDCGTTRKGLTHTLRNTRRKNRERDRRNN